MKIIKFKSKRKKRDEELLREYENGEVLQVENGINNKEYFQKFK